MFCYEEHTDAEIAAYRKKSMEESKKREKQWKNSYKSRCATTYSTCIDDVELPWYNDQARKSMIESDVFKTL
jgi:hypothetical protein